MSDSPDQSSDGSSRRTMTHNGVERKVRGLTPWGLYGCELAVREGVVNSATKLLHSRNHAASGRAYPRVMGVARRKHELFAGETGHGLTTLLEMLPQSVLA